MNYFVVRPWKDDESLQSILRTVVDAAVWWRKYAYVCFGIFIGLALHPLVTQAFLVAADHLSTELFEVGAVIEPTIQIKR